MFGYRPGEMLGHKPSDFMKQAMKPAFETEYLQRLKNEGFFSGTSLYFH
jgi:hypothetical protein